MSTINPEFGALIRNCSSLNDPERMFIIGRWTYGQIYALAEEIIEWAASLPEDGAGVCLRSDDRGLFAAALVAGMHMDKQLVVPSAYSKDRLAELHERTGYGAAIADSSEDFPGGVRIFSPKESPPVFAPRTVLSQTDQDRVFVSLFTGGSTGKPCMWPKTVGNLLGEAIYLARHFGVLSSDRFLATVPPYHIYGMLYSVLVPFVSGASVAADTPIYPQEIADASDRYDASVLVGIPLHYRMLNGRALRGKRLRMAFSSASRLDEPDDRAFFRQTGAPINDVFGSTETGGVAERCRARGKDAFTAFEPVAWKIKRGHLYVKTPFGSPALETDSQGYVKTGDRVQSAEGAGFVFKSRSDGIVKIGGNRVNLEDVRDMLKRYAPVEDAVVLTESGPGGKGSRIVAVVQGSGIERTDLKRHLLSHLDPIAVPRRMIFVGRLPVKATGKYDRTAIRALLKTD